MISNLFSSLPLAPELLQNLASLEYHEMTPIQAKSLPFILNNEDILAKAKTGSGKTAAFGLGLLSKINPAVLAPQACVICPTRELADQVCHEIRRLARLTPNIRVITLCGGKPVRAQTESLKNGAHIVVGTPGRLQEHIAKKSLNISDIRTLVLDEADRMLDMGFYDDMMQIIKSLPTTKQTLLFSATYPSGIQKISKAIQHKPIMVTCETKDDKPDITQIAYPARPHEKVDAMLALLTHYKASSAMIFCNTKMQCDALATALVQKGIDALALHGDLEQKERDEVLLQFANHSCAFLVATDVAARGIDIKDLPVVINYELPAKADQYIHRIGRTGRCGQSGIAVSLYSHAEMGKLAAFEDATGSPFERLTADHLKKKQHEIAQPRMHTLCLNCGKKNKIRPGDILGTLTGIGGLTGEQVGKIHIFDFYAYVAVHRSESARVLKNLQGGKMKGRSFKIRYCDNPLYSGTTHDL